MPDYIKPLLGEILVERKKITPAQLQLALQQQQQKGGFLGEILVSLGIIEERDIVVALIVQCGMPYIAVDKYEISKDIIRLIPEDVARRERIIALDKVGDVLSIVTINPLNVAQYELIEKLTGCRIATFISTKTEIDTAIARNYRIV
jgi:hypothetical protein